MTKGFAFALAGAICACTAAGDQRKSERNRDPAGVQPAETGAPPSLPQGSNGGVSGMAAGNLGLRKIEQVSWRILWTVGGDERDTLFDSPVWLAADNRYLYVDDYTKNRVTALRVADGSVAWQFGSGQPALDGPQSVAAWPHGGVLVNEPKLGRLTLVDQSGSFVRAIHRSHAGALHSVCVADSTEFVGDVSDSMPITGFDAAGRTQSRSYMPWQTLRNAGFEQTQAIAERLAPGMCAIALQMDRGFAIWRRGKLAGYDYVEAPPHDGRHGTALGISGDSDTVAVAFEGLTEQRLRLIDFYRVDDGRYLKTILTPMKMVFMTRNRSTFFVISMRQGLPLVAALRANSR